MSSDHSRSSVRERLREKIARHGERVERVRAKRLERAARREGGLSREQIAAAAVAIADAQGLDAVSMRKIAAVLGSGTMSLYHHVRTKDDLVAIMDDLIMSEVLVPASALKTGWRSAIAAIARQTRRTFARHPWALTAKPRGGEGNNGMRHMEQSLAALAGTGLSFGDQLAVLTIVDDYVFGHAHRAIDTGFDPAWERNMGEAARFLGERLATGEFPHFAAAIGNDDPGEVMRRISEGLKREERFDDGLEALLDGLSRRFRLPESGDGRS